MWYYHSFLTRGLEQLQPDSPLAKNVSVDVADSKASAVRLKNMIELMTLGLCKQVLMEGLAIHACAAWCESFYINACRQATANNHCDIVSISV